MDSITRNDNDHVAFTHHSLTAIGETWASTQAFYQADRLPLSFSDTTPAFFHDHIQVVHAHSPPTHAQNLRGRSRDVKDRNRVSIMLEGAAQVKLIIRSGFPVPVQKRSVP